MKRIAVIMLVIIMLLLLPACAKKDEQVNDITTQETPVEDSSDSNDTPEEIIEEEKTEGCFEDIVTDINDSFGEKIGEEHTVVAAADAYNKDHAYYGEVKVYYDYNSKKIVRSHSCNVGIFVINVPDTYTSIGGSVVVRRVSYRIDEATYDNAETDPQVLYDALIEGKEVVFSLDNGKYIFTISGKGLADILEALPD